MSRPSSRVTRDEGYGSRIQQQQQQGPSRGDGSSNGRAAGPPFTPGPASASVTGSYRAYAAAGAAGPPPPRTSASTSTRSLGLSAKEVDRLSETIASVQRGSSRLSMHGSGNGSGSANDDMRPSASAPVLGLRNGKAQSNGGERERVRSSRDHAGKGKGRASAIPEASFIAEASFMDAPLNSRVATTTTARTTRSDGAASSPRKARPLPTEAAKERLTSTRLRQIIAGSSPAGNGNGLPVDDDEDDEADLKQYTEYEEDQEEDEGYKSTEDLGAASLEIQEALLIEDLLSVLMGIEGQFIVRATDTPEESHEEEHGMQFVVDERIDPSLQDLVYRILPLATYYAGIDSFVSVHQHLSCGLTYHALCSGMRDLLLQDYLVLVAQLEEQFASSPSFSLQRFYVYVQPMLHRFFLGHTLAMDLMATPADPEASGDLDDADASKDEDDDDDDRFGGGAALREAMKAMNGGDSSGKTGGWAAGGTVKGGEVLAVIDERLQRMSGDPIALSLYADLLLRASQPYAQTLVKWIGTGQLSDPHDEFMIRESRSVDRSSLEQDYTDEYWERKYTLKDVSLASSSSVGPRSDERGPLDQRGLLGTMAIDGLDQAPPRTRAEKRGAGLGGGAIVPSFLERMKLKILLAGKYLNVIRECGSATGDDLRAIIARQASQLSGSRGTDPEELVRINSADFAAKIDSAYLSANTALLQLLITQQSLFPRLRSLKHHFFLDHGDSFTHFLDLAQAELTKRARHISLSKLQSLLDVAIRNPGSASGADPYKEDVKVAMSTSTLSEWLMNIVKTKGALGNWAGDEGDALSMPMESVGSLKALSLPAESVASIRELDRASGGKKDDKSASALTGFDALSLDYTVQFPLSLVVSRKAILRYQLIFRHLLSLKHLEQLLTATWAEHARAPAWRARSGHPVLEKWKNRVFALRARMLAFVQQMYAFAVAEVLEGNWRALMAKLESVATVDGLLRYHHDFLDSCLKECMLTNDDLLKTQNRLMTAITVFAGQKTRYTAAAAKIARATAEARERGEDWQMVSMASEEDSLSRIEIHFHKNQRQMADKVQFHAFSETNALLALLVRLANTVPQTDGPIA